MDEDLDRLLDQLMADGFTLGAFMLRVSVELARRHTNPEAWAEQFILDLHSGMDENEARMGARGRPIHELARRRIDTLGHEVRLLLRLRPRS